MTIEEMINIIENYNEDDFLERFELNEGVRFFKLSKKINKAVYRAEKRAAKFRYADKDKMYKPLMSVVTNLKNISKRISTVEQGFIAKKMSHKESKSQISKIVPELKRTVKYAKSNLNIKLMNRTKLWWILGMATVATAGLLAGGIHDEVIDFIKDSKTITPEEASRLRNMAQKEMKTSNKFFKGEGAVAIKNNGIRDMVSNLEMMDATADRYGKGVASGGAVAATASLTSANKLTTSVVSSIDGKSGWEPVQHPNVGLKDIEQPEEKNTGAVRHPNARAREAEVKELTPQQLELRRRALAGTADFTGKEGEPLPSDPKTSPGNDLSPQQREMRRRALTGRADFRGR